MRPVQMIVLAALIGLSACSGSIFNLEPMVDSRRDAQGNVILRDTPRMWADWTSGVDRTVAKEAAGDPPHGGMPSWQAHWQRVMEVNSTSREHPQKYIDYLLDARRRAGLPELEASQGASHSEASEVVARYEHMVQAVRETPPDARRIDRVIALYAPEAAAVMSEAVRAGSIDKEMLFAQCGALDMPSCFDPTHQQPVGVTFRDIEGPERVACIAYAQDATDGGLVALVHLVRKSADWSVLSISKREFDAGSYVDIAPDPTTLCWAPERERADTSNDTCALIQGIQSLPFRKEQGGIDPRYDALMGVEVTTRQVAECIVDTTPMADPRQSPNRANTFVVGDAAYIVFTRKSGIAFESLLPAAVSAKMKDKGANAYFEWVAQPGSRAELAARAVASTRD